MKSTTKIVSMSQERREEMYREGMELLKKKAQDEKNKNTTLLEECTHKPQIDAGSNRIMAKMSPDRKGTFHLYMDA